MQQRNKNKTKPKVGCSLMVVTGLQKKNEK